MMEEKVRVLVADDNKEVRSALRLALLEVSDQCSAPCTILEAGDATDTLILLKNRDVDVMLIDWELPGLDAVGQLPQIITGFPECTVIAISGRPEVRDEPLQKGADYFVGRNDPPAELLALLHAIWASRGA
jgi:CheY-like chemotaxis protein